MILTDTKMALLSVTTFCIWYIKITFATPHCLMYI